MAGSSIPPIPQLKMSAQAWLDKWLLRFRDNDYFEIDEQDFREFATDIAGLVAFLANLTALTVRGNMLPLQNLDDFATLQQDVFVVGQLANVDNNTTAADAAINIIAGPAQYRLVKDSNGPLWAFINAKPTTSTMVRARWIKTGEVQTDDFPFLELEDREYEAGDYVKYTFAGGQTRMLQVKRDLPLAGQGPMNPTPTGLDTDPNYTIFAGLAQSAGAGGPEVVQVTGQSVAAVMSQKAVTDALAAGAGGGGPEVVQVTGQSIAAVMSQKAVTDALAAGAGAGTEAAQAGSVVDFAAAYQTRTTAAALNLNTLTNVVLGRSVRLVVTSTAPAGVLTIGGQALTSAQAPEFTAPLAVNGVETNWTIQDQGGPFLAGYKNVVELRIISLVNKILALTIDPLV